jgi:hypothetical protein
MLHCLSWSLLAQDLVVVVLHRTGTDDSLPSAENVPALVEMYTARDRGRGIFSISAPSMHPGLDVTLGIAEQQALASSATAVGGSGLRGASLSTT